MKITFLGGAQHVTGSCMLLEHEEIRILVDCGMAQGQDAYLNNEHLPFDRKTINYVLLTHAHVDHCGRLPMLVDPEGQDGFTGTVICTKATADLCEIMLGDCARIQEEDREWQRKKDLRAGKSTAPALYTREHAATVLKLFRPVDYGEEVELGGDISVTFTDAGHMLGSSSITLKYPIPNGETNTIVFSGDIGNTDQPIIKDPILIDAAEYVVMESTYALKNHASKPKSTQELARELKDIIEYTFSRGGKVIIPAFSVGRSQEILYLLRAITEETGKPIPTYLDSPLSVRATAVFLKDAKGYYDEEAMAILEKGKSPILFPGFHAVTSTEESKALNSLEESCVIIASSGMCEAGRIQHHLKHNLYRPENTIVFTGYQAEGSTGRKILEGEKRVKILGEWIAVQAKVRKLEGISGHADHSGLLDWIDNYSPKPHKVFVVHGDKESSTGFAELLRKTRYFYAWAPSWGDSFELEPICHTIFDEEIDEAMIEYDYAEPDTDYY